MLQGRGGKDTVRGGSGNDLIRETLVDLVAGETFDGGANVADDLNDATFDPFDAMEIIGSAGPDSIRVSVSNGQLIISELLGSTVVGSFTGIGVERLRLTGEGAADTFLLVGALEQGGLKTLSIDTGAGADLVTTQLTAGNDDVTVVSSGSTTTVGWTGHYALTIGNTTTNDRLRIEALGGNDILNAAGVAAPVCGAASTSSAATATTRSSARRPTTTSTPASATTASPAWAATTRSSTPAAPTRSSRASPGDFGLYGNLLVIGTLSGRQLHRARPPRTSPSSSARRSPARSPARRTRSSSAAPPARSGSTASSAPACSPGAAARTSPAATAATRTASRRPACAAAP